MSTPPSLYNFPGAPVRIVDEEDSSIALKIIASGPGEGGKALTSSKPFLFDIAEGLVAGHTGHRSYGFCPDVDNVEITLWPGPAGLYVFPIAQQQMEVVSTDNTNDKAGGTGAHTVTIVYLDNTFAQHTETITLNGTTAVPTAATNIYRINCFMVASAGSTGKAAGNIDIRNLADTPIYGRILAGRTVCQSTVYTVPDSTIGSAHLVSWHIGIGATAAGHYGIFRLQCTTNPMGALTPGIFYSADTAILQDNHTRIEISIPYTVMPGSDIMITVVSDGATANAIATGSFTFYTEPAS